MDDTPQGTGTFVSPVSGALEVTSDYGDRVLTSGPDFHEGIDFRAAENTPLVAIDGGTVLYAGWSPQGFGNVVIIDHGNGIVTTTAHMNAVDVQQGDVIAQGDPIGLSGNTGFSEAPHIHIEMNVGGDVALYEQGYTRNRGGRHIDPEDHFPITGQGPAESYLGRVVFQNGDNLPIIREIQEDLIAAGYDINGGTATGFYGSETEAAVRQFQIDQGFTGRDVDGKFGPQTREALDGATPVQDPETPTPETPTQEPETPETPEPGTPDPASPTTGAVDTDGPFAATSVGGLYGVAGGTPLGALDGEQTYALSRALFGDGPGAAALEALDQHYGTGDGTLVQREIALANHEGQLNFGRENADPASGFNFGTFQIGGARSTPEVSRERYNGLVADGIAQYEAISGVTVDRESLSPADLDIFSHIGHIAEKGAISATSTVDSHFTRLADPSLQGDALAAFMSDEIQVGVPAIGQSVVAQTDPQSGTGVDLAAVEARAQEPDATRTEPALPVLSSRVAADYAPAVEEWQQTLLAAGYDLGPSGADGDFGEATRRATIQAQRDANLTGDGVVGAATWEAYAQTRAQIIEAETPPTQDPGEAPGEPAEPAETPEREALGASPPEEYTVRQFDQTLAVGEWSADAARATPTADDARWVADTETAGTPGVQLTFAGLRDPRDAALVAEPGSRVAEVLATAGDGVAFRTSTQNGSPGSYAQIPLDAILAHYDSVDAFVTDARTQLAIQEGAPTQSPETVSADGLLDARLQVARDPETAQLLGDFDSLSAQMLASYTADPERVVTALNEAAAQGALSPADVEALVREADPEARDLPEATDTVLSQAVNARAGVARDAPETAAAVDTIRAATDGIEAHAADAPTQETAAPAEEVRRAQPGGDGAMRDTDAPVVTTTPADVSPTY